MTSNSLTENEKKDIPSQILKTIFGFLDPNICFLEHLYVPVILNSSGQLAELIVSIIPTHDICIVPRSYLRYIHLTTFSASL